MPTLAELAPGTKATVVDVLGDDEIAIRVMEMGVVEDEAITVVGRAPFGDPIEVSLRGYRLSLRRAEAEKVQVRVQTD